MLGKPLRFVMKLSRTRIRGVSVASLPVPAVQKGIRQKLAFPQRLFTSSTLAMVMLVWSQALEYLFFQMTSLLGILGQENSLEVWAAYFEAPEAEKVGATARSTSLGANALSP
jgi:hypothetical protein